MSENCDGYVPEWWPKNGNGEILGILRMCEVLHMDHTGSYQDMQDKEREGMLKALRWKRENWLHPISNYDRAVFFLMCRVSKERTAT